MLFICECFERYVQAKTCNYEKSTYSKKKVQKLMTYIGGGWCMKKSAKGLPPSRITKLSKKVQEKQDEIQKTLYEANNWWNDWRFQLHCNKLE